MKLACCLMLLTLCWQNAWAESAGTAADCSVKNRHLHVEASVADSRGGRFSLRLDDFASLASNESLTWKLVGDSASLVTYQDSFGFSWIAPLSSAPKGSCEVQLIQNDGQLEIDVECHELRNKGNELPGYLSPPAQHFICRLN